MKKISFLAVIALLYGCASPTVVSQKAPGYNGTISKLSVSILELGDRKSTGGFGNNRENAKAKVNNSVSNLQIALQTYLVPYFNSNGIAAGHALPSGGGAAAKAAGFSHTLVMTPSSAEAQCYHRHCQATVHIDAMLLDLNSKAIVWAGKFVAPDVSASQSIDANLAYTMGAQIVDAFQAGNLVAQKK